VFDNQILAQAAFFASRSVKFPAPPVFQGGLVINLKRSIVYGLGVLKNRLPVRLQKWGMVRFPIFDAKGKKLAPS